MKKKYNINRSLIEAATLVSEEKSTAPERGQRLC